MTDRDTNDCYNEERLAFDTKLARQSAQGFLKYVEEYAQRFEGGLLRLSPDERTSAIAILNRRLKFEFEQSENGLHSGVNLVFSGMGAYKEFDFGGKPKEGHMLHDGRMLYGHLINIGALIVPTNPYFFSEGVTGVPIDSIVSPVLIMRWPFSSDGSTLESFRDMTNNLAVVPLVYDGMQLQVTN